MANLKDGPSKKAKSIGTNVDHNLSNWSEIAKELLDKLTGKDMAVTYEFNNLEIDLPKATGPGGQEIGSAKWKINGKFVMATQVQDKSKVIE